jgi:hypothetical protein
MEIIGPYENVCEFESKGIEVCGFIEGIEAHHANFLDFPIIMDIVVIDVPNTWRF